MSIYENPEAVEQLAEQAGAEDAERQAEIEALCTAINCLSDPLLRRILLTLVELVT